jgi:hypothetical protein
MIPHERELVEKFHKEPFVLLGGNSDESRSALAKIIKNERITWPNIFDGPKGKGEVARQWNVSGWPTLYIIDDKGVIRYRNPREKRLEDAIAKLLKDVPGKGDRTKK